MKELSRILSITILLLLITGCQSNKEIDNRAIVVAVGLDKAENNQVEVTLQIIKIAQASKEGGSTETGNPVWTNASKGNTVFEAVRNQLTKVNRKPFFGHVQLIIIGEELAKDGIIEVINFFERDHEIRLTPYVLVSKGLPAKKVLEAQSELEDFPAIHLKSIIENNVEDAKTQDTMLIDLLKAMNRPGHDPALGVVSGDGNKGQLNIKDLHLDGAAVLRKQKLTGWLSPIDTRALLFIQDKITNVVVNVSDPLAQDKLVAIELLDAKIEKDVKLNDGEITLVIKGESNGTIGGQESIEVLNTTSNIEKLEQNTEEEITKEITRVLKKGQKEFRSDFFAFSRVVHKKYPDYWKTIENEWDEIFSKANIEVKVKVNVKRTGLITQPTSPE